MIVNNCPICGIKRKKHAHWYYDNDKKRWELWTWDSCRRKKPCNDFHFYLDEIIEHEHKFQKINKNTIICVECGKVVFF